ncbi:MAG: hypothetical protein IPJ79_08040 [Bacteroidetes bacterium]|nr:hypothetical protein [Bacteroidota bacterium]
MKIRPNLPQSLMAAIWRYFIPGKRILLFYAFAFFVSISNSLYGQKPSKADSLRKAFEQSKNYKEYLTNGSRLCNELLRTDPQAALHTGKKVLHMADSLQKAGIISDSIAERLRVIINSSIANAYMHLGDIDAQMKLLMKNLEIAHRSGNKQTECITLEAIAGSYLEQGYSKDASHYYRKALAVARDMGITYFIALELGNIGTCFKDDPDSALWYYGQSLSEMQKPDMKDAEGAMGWMFQNIGEVFDKREQFDSALYYYNRSLQIRMSINHYEGQQDVYAKIAGVLFKQGHLNEALKDINTGIQIAETKGFRQSLYESYKLRSEIYSKLGRYKEALEDQLRFVQLRDSIVSENNSRQLVQQTMQYEYGRKLLSDSLEFSKKETVLKERTQKQRIGLFAAAGGLLLLIALVYSIYRGKKRSDELLLNILPEETANELKAKGSADAKQFDNVTVMFTDFKGFTQISEKLSPAELVAEIDTCFKAFDNIISKHNIEKIKTIGDSYMCAGGLPVANKTHATDVVKAALEIQKFMLEHLRQRKSEGKEVFEIRIGIHTGPVVAGIVGIKKFAYDSYGDTVNITSRMESSGEAGKVNISGSTYELVKEKFNCTHRGKIKAKNKGEIDMYFVEQ